MRDFLIPRGLEVDFAKYMLSKMISNRRIKLIKLLLAFGSFSLYFLTHFEYAKTLSIILALLYFFVSRINIFRLLFGLSIWSSIALFWIFSNAAFEIKWIIFGFLLVLIQSSNNNYSSEELIVPLVGTLVLNVIGLIIMNFMFKDLCATDLCGLSSSKNQYGHYLVFLQLFSLLTILAVIEQEKLSTFAVAILWIIVSVALVLLVLSMGARSSAMGSSLLCVLGAIRILCRDEKVLPSLVLLGFLSLVPVSYFLYSEQVVIFFRDNLFRLFFDTLLRIELSWIPNVSLFGTGGDIVSGNLSNEFRVPHNSLASLISVYGILSPLVLFYFLRLDLFRNSTAIIIIIGLMPLLIFSSIGKWFVLTLMLGLYRDEH